MTIPFRDVNMIPELVWDPNLHEHVPNVNKTDIRIMPLSFAYRRTVGADRRVRLVIPDLITNSMLLYHFNTEPVDKIIHVTPNTTYDLNRNWFVSSTLVKWWTEEYANGNKNLDEGKMYSMARKKFNILTTGELDLLTSATFNYNLNIPPNEKATQY